MGSQIDWRIEPGTRFTSRALLLGWLLTSLGIYGAWLRCQTAALSLSGPDLAEFAKFLPSVQNGLLHLHRQFFHLPAFGLAVGLALLVNSPGLRFSTPARCLLVCLAALESLQLLPPAWSFASLQAAEFRAQVVAVVVCWLMLIFSRVLGRLPLWFTGPVVGMTSILSATLSSGQLRAITPEVSALYGSSPIPGWGFWAAQVGLLMLAAASLWAPLGARAGERKSGS